LRQAVHNPKKTVDRQEAVEETYLHMQNLLMTEHREILEILAQVFVAFAGFAGVIAAFSTIRLSPEATAFRLRALVAVALFSLVVSLLPFLFGAFGASEIATVRISAFVAALGMSGFAVWVIRELLALYSARLLDTQVYAVLLMGVGAIAILALFAVAGGLLEEIASAVYLCGLFVNLVLCSYYFIMVIFAVEIKSTK